MRERVLAAMALSVALATPARAAPTVADRTVARFSDPEAASAAGQRFVMMRELILESWLVAFERSPTSNAPPDDKSVRIALERHVIEAVLGDRPLSAAFEAKVASRIVDVRHAAKLTVGGEKRWSALVEAATGSHDGGAVELASILRRRARAELYLESAVGLSYEPTDGEIAAFHSTQSGALFAKDRWNEPMNELAVAAPRIRAYLRTLKLREGALAYQQAVRSKLRLEIVSEN